MGNYSTSPKNFFNDDEDDDQDLAVKLRDWMSETLIFSLLFRGINDDPKGDDFPPDLSSREGVESLLRSTPPIMIGLAHRAFGNRKKLGLKDLSLIYEKTLEKAHAISDPHSKLNAETGAPPLSPSEDPPTPILCCKCGETILNPTAHKGHTHISMAIEQDRRDFAITSCPGCGIVLEVSLLGRVTRPIDDEIFESLPEEVKKIITKANPDFDD